MGWHIVFVAKKFFCATDKKKRHFLPFFVVDCTSHVHPLFAICRALALMRQNPTEGSLLLSSTQANAIAKDLRVCFDAAKTQEIFDWPHGMGKNG